MRVTCPNCGERDRREFYVKGAALVHPGADAPVEAWHEHVHMRDNPAGDVHELWYHEMGCGAWLDVCRNVVSHEVVSAVLAAGSDLGGAR